MTISAPPARSQLPALSAAGVHRVPLLRANPASLAGYGRLVPDFDAEEVWIETWPAPGWRPVASGTGHEGGVTEGEFAFAHHGEWMACHNHAVDGQYITGWFTDPPAARGDVPAADTTRIYVREANYHPDGGQVFFPTEGTPYVALLALPGDDVRPEDFRAFYFDGTAGVQLRPSVWHQPVFPLAPRAAFRDKQGRVHACIEVDFVSEFGVYLEVPLHPPR